MFPPEGFIAPKELVIVSDQIASPADFLLHRILAAHLKQPQEARCLILSFSESLTRWTMLAGKANINLAQLISSGAVIIKDEQSIPPSPLGNEQAALRPLFDEVIGVLDKWDGTSSPLLVIVEDISVLEWIGFSSLEVTRFVRALFAATRKVSAALLIRHHITTPGEIDDLMRLLLQLCTYHVEVLPLSSGRSGSVSGEIALHPGPGTIRPIHKPIPRSSAIHYRLTETSCVFFDRGTGSGVL